MTDAEHNAADWDALVLGLETRLNDERPRPPQEIEALLYAICIGKLRARLIRAEAANIELLTALRRVEQWLVKGMAARGFKTSVILDDVRSTIAQESDHER